MRNFMPAAETACFVLLLAYLIWVPMPFGSASDASQPALIIPPLLICAAAALVRSRRLAPMAQLQPARMWIAGAVLFALVIAIQLLPMPMPLLRLVSPESAQIWASATHLAALAGMATPAMHPITVDPADTALQLFRVLAYFATFLAAMLLVRSAERRMGLVIVLASAATFEAVYAVREAELQRYAIWGWRNTLMFGRATGTFVNPNHFAHYAAIILPMTLFASAHAWHRAAPAGVMFRQRFLRLVEKKIPLFAFGLLAAAACIVAIIVSQSRGGLLAVVAGFAITGAIASGSKHAMRRGVLIAVAAMVILISAMLLLGRTETASRMEGTSPSSFFGRRASLVAALHVWDRFPLFGSGAGTFEDIVTMNQDDKGQPVFNHAHNDYVEVAATTGALGLMVALVPLLGGYAALARQALGKRAAYSSWRRRAFQAAALTSIAIALVHALVDFNFFIPANPITLAAIAGSAVCAKESEH